MPTRIAEKDAMRTGTGILSSLIVGLIAALVGEKWIGDDETSMTLERAVAYRDTARAAGHEVYTAVPEDD